MRYLVLIYGSEQQWESMTPEAMGAMLSQYNSYTQELASSGVLRGGDELQPTFTATTVRVRDGKQHNTDGPFAETKEQLGGYYIIETDSLDQAIAWAAKCPGATYGSVEVRPMVVASPEHAAATGAESVGTK
jgi:hypothetical protein